MASEFGFDLACLNQHMHLLWIEPVIHLMPHIVLLSVSIEIEQALHLKCSSKMGLVSSPERVIQGVNCDGYAACCPHGFSTSCAILMIS
jgi:hypothetical protein